MNNNYSNLVETLESRQLFAATVEPLSYAPPIDNVPREDAPVFNSTAAADGTKANDQGMRPNRPRVEPPNA